MWIAITLVILNILIFGALLFIFRCLVVRLSFRFQTMNV